MSAVFGQTARNLLEAAMIREKPVETIGNALWLYIRLLVGSNYRGMLSRHIDNLAADLSVTAERLDRWLKRLTDAGLIEIKSPAPFLVIKLGMWSDSDVKSVDSQPPAYSYPAKRLQRELLRDSYRQPEAVTGHAANEELLQEILATLGESDAASFEKAVELYSPSVIRATLNRVRRAQGIRKSRTALFRHLLPRIAREASLET
jgi:DNA-binding transcriptional ArsR family regulator